jgi:hopanoid biosynthesis associated RND transporter like protein HpnN
MSAEGKPHIDLTLLGRLALWITRPALRFPQATVAIGVLAAIVSLYLCQTRLGFRTSRADLLNPNSAFNRLWIDYTKEFSDAEDVIVVVEGARREVVIPVLEELAGELRSEARLWNTVLHKIDLTKIRNKGLFYLKPEELAGIEQFLDKFAPVLRGEWAQLNLGSMAAEMANMLQSTPTAPEHSPQAQALQEAIQRQIIRFLDSLTLALTQRGAYQSPWPDMSRQMAQDQRDCQYLLAKQGRMGFILLRFAPAEKESFVGNKEAVDALRRLADQTRARHPETAIGLTGLPLIEHDEMSSSESSMSIATILSIIGVVIVVLLGFGGLRHSILPVAALFLGMIWSLGYTALTVGHLNILSSAFGAILTGLGINYGIYIIARYLHLRELNQSVEDSLLEAIGTVAPAITMSMMTTAAAFFMAGFTEFTGVAELGLIAGGGVILCWLAAMTVLPALVCISDKRHCRLLPKALVFDHWLKPFFDHPRLLLAASTALTVVLMLGITRLWYDHNLLHMQAEGLESVALEQKIITEGDQSASFAISIADDPQTLLERKKQFLRLPSVKKVVEIDSILTPDDSMTPPRLAEKQRIIEQINRRLAVLPRQVPQIPLSSLDELGRVFGGTQQFQAGNLPEAGIRQQLQQIGSLLARLAPAECYARLAAFQQSMARDLLTRLYALRAAADPHPPQLSDLPDSLVARFVGRNGKHLMKIYAKGDIWDMDAMEQFVSEVRSIDANVTGNPVQIYEASRQMKRSYEQATWLALCTILPFLFLNFGNLRDTFLAILPLGLCMLQMFGIMGLLDIPLNAANMISLPLMLGMGVDNGVDIICDFRRQRGKYKISPSTAVAVALNTLTTMVGFAVLMIADHRGLQSLGRVLTIGMACCLFTSLGILPAILTWITRNRRDEEIAVETAQPAAESLPAADQYDLPPADHDYIHLYPQDVNAQEEDQPLSDIWQPSADSTYSEEEPDKEEIYPFTPPASPYDEQSWPQRRSA